MTVDIDNSSSQQSREYTVEELGKVIEFYTACLEMEDRRSLEIPLKSRERSFITPWADSEPLFHPAAERVDFVALSPAETRFLTSNQGQAGGGDRFFYGFPLRLTERDYLVPLFILEVEIHHDDDRLYLLPTDPNAIEVNRHLLGLHHLSLEEQRAIEDALGEGFGSFAARLRAVFEYLGESSLPLESDRIVPLPEPGAARETWINCPIVFRSARSAYTGNLRQELSAFIRYPRLLHETRRTALSHLLARPPSPVDPPVELLQVVPLNREQEQAARSACSNALTVITGPPGTGKSQIVIDLLASYAAAGRAVLFCSKNNKAVDVVRERLSALLGREQDWTLRLGNRHHMSATKDEMIRRIDSLTPSTAVAPVFARSDWDETLDRAHRAIDQLDHLQRRLTEARVALEAAVLRVPDAWIAATPETFEWRPPRDQICEAHEWAVLLAGVGRGGWALRLVRRLFPGLLRRRMQRILDQVCTMVPETVSVAIREGVEGQREFRPFAEAFARLRAYSDWLVVRDAVLETESQLFRLPTAEQLCQKIRDAGRARSEASTRWLRDGWTWRVSQERQKAREQLIGYFDQLDHLYETRGAAFVTQLETLSRTIQTLGRILSTWIVTNLSVRRSIPMTPALFDLVIIDEASQCDIASAIPLLYRAQRAVIIGDPHQLRHITILRDRDEAQLAERHGVAHLVTDWSYVAQSLYDLAARTRRRDGEEPVFLCEHFRSWPLIAEFSNRRIYSSRLRLRTDVASLRERLDGHAPGIVWHDVPGQVPMGQRSAWNPDEVKAVEVLLTGWRDSGFLSRPDLRFGIVTPFRRQADRISEELRRRPWWDNVRERLIIGTAHQFQGDECDVMVLSTVLSTGMRDQTRRWLVDTENLLNVAITRARGTLHVVGDRSVCERSGGLLGEFARYVGEMSDTFTLGSQNPAQANMAELLACSGMWFRPQFVCGHDRFDFLVVSPLGVRYDLEVDGRQHQSPEQIHADRVRDERVSSAGYRVVRVRAVELLDDSDRVLSRLARLP